MAGPATLRQLSTHRPCFVKQATPHRRNSAALLKCQAVAATPANAVSLHIGETTIQFPFRADSAAELEASLQKLLQTFAAKAKAERPKRWDMMEYKFKGDTERGELEYLEFFCNPNAHPTPFDAKILITIRGAGMKITTEGKLVAIKSDLDNFLSAQKS